MIGKLQRAIVNLQQKFSESIDDAQSIQSNKQVSLTKWYIKRI